MKNIVLVVDDCATTRKIVTLYLKSGGFETIWAEDGIDGLEKLAMHSVNLVITDLNMPQMDGIEFIEALRDCDGTRDLPIILLTTEQEEDEKERVMTAGASIYIEKPVLKQKLLQEVDRLLSKR